jgi:hypothetical protein
VSKNFRSCDLEQPFLLPPSLQDWLPENHLERFIAELTNGLDLSKIYGFYGRRDGRGKAAYHPVMLVRLLLYGYCVGVTGHNLCPRFVQIIFQLTSRILFGAEAPRGGQSARARDRILARVGTTGIPVSV